jgi:hypothetical protein
MVSGGAKQKMPVSGPLPIDTGFALSAKRVAFSCLGVAFGAVNWP